MDTTILKKLGLSDKETGAYLKLLEHGALSVRGLSQAAGLNRGTTYDILKKLQEAGLVSYYHQAKKQKFVAEDAGKLLRLAQSREQELKETKDGLARLIPELKSLQNKDGGGPTARFYEGKTGVRFILEDLLATVGGQKEREYCVFSATKASEDINAAYPDFTPTRIRKRIRVKAISLAPGGSTHGLDERRWLGTNDDSATYILIYAGKCAFISRDAGGAPVGVIIENKMIYETQKIIFQRLWELLDEK
jgi:HTH-type transcriptional regulator, sugar sensing transcriptional regulator